MKPALKIAALLIATIIITAALGWVYAFNALQEWANQYVAVSMLTAGAIAAMPRTHIAVKAIAKKSRPNYAAMTIRQLKTLAKGTAIKNWSRLGKGALIAALIAQN